jgi:hypothetical protein
MMKTALTLAAAALALSGSTAVASSFTEKGEARLSKMLEGRTAGQPASCINTMRPDKMEVIDGVAVVYKDGKTIWVARPVDPHMLRPTDALLIDRFSASRLCVQESMRTIDRYDHFITGAVFLQDFVPYTRQ